MMMRSRGLITSVSCALPSRDLLLECVKQLGALFPTYLNLETTSSAGIFVLVSSCESLRIQLYENNSTFAKVAGIAVPLLTRISLSSVYDNQSPPPNVTLIDYLRPPKAGDILKLQSQNEIKCYKTGGQTVLGPSSIFKELCMPFSHETERQSLVDKVIAGGLEMNNCGIFRVRRSSGLGSPGFRIFPCRRVGLTFRLDEQDMDAFVSASSASQQVSITKLGSQNDQTQLVNGLSLPFEIRATTSSKDSVYYLEGTDAVLEGTIAALQSTRVLSGDSTVSDKINDSRINNGNCWIEVREMGKRPMDLIRGKTS